jgi:tRNA (guanine37-N1)-methyltransferase
MQIDVITAFPKIIDEPLQQSIISKAQQNKIVTINIHDLRDWAKDRHKTIDDAPYGGGAGMIFKIEPLYNCLSEIFKKVSGEKKKILLTSPRGKKLSQDTAIKLSIENNLIIICGHYKGVDERIKEFFPIDEISVGDYVLSGGELPALVIIDAVVRLLPGAINDIDSAWTDSFSEGLLDCDYYTRPESFNGVNVPELLLSGDHKKINKWREEKKIEITKKNRPDLYKKYIKELK